MKKRKEWIVVIFGFLLLHISKVYTQSLDTLVQWKFIPQTESVSKKNVTQCTARNSEVFLWNSGGIIHTSLLQKDVIYANNWQTEAEGKFWQTSGINAIGYADLQILYKQYGTDNAPKNWKLQYKTLHIDWTDIIDWNIENTTMPALYGPFDLPLLCNEIDTFYIRWHVNGIESINGGEITAEGCSYLGDIFITGNSLGTQNNPLRICTVSEFVDFRDSINTGASSLRGIDISDGGSGKYFMLSENIDLNTVCGNSIGNWLSIGTALYPFKGNFNGDNYKIMGLYINDTTAEKIGLFGTIENAIIANVNLQIDTFIGKNYVGGIVGSSHHSNIRNCYVEGSTRIEGNNFVGGITGIVKSSTLQKCTNTLSVKGDSCIGGIVGLACLFDSNDSIIHCLNTGRIIGRGGTTAGSIGGIVGEMKGENTPRVSYYIMDSCFNYGYIESKVFDVGGICGKGYYSKIMHSGNFALIEVSGIGFAHSGYNVGGICGNAEKRLNVEYSLNYGDIQTQYANSKRIGGICGKMGEYSSIEYSANNGNIQARGNNVGGLCGLMGAYTSIKYSCNIGNVVSLYANNTTLNNGVGGICGYVEASSSASILYCLNAGHIVAKNSIKNYVGGIYGYILASGTVGTSCLNVGTVEGNNANHTGGISGIGTYTNCFFDKQMCSVPSPFGMWTSQLTAYGAIWEEGISTEHWRFQEGMYPRPKGIEDIDITVLAATPIFLDTLDYVEAILQRKASNTLYIGGYDSVLWYSKQQNVVFLPNQANIVAIGYDTLCAIYRQAIQCIPLYTCVIEYLDTVVEVCNSFYWEDSLYVFTPETALTQIYTNKHGCDSVITLFLTIYQSDTTILYDSVCQSDVLYCYDAYFEDIDVREHGSFSIEQTLSRTPICDSIVILQIKVFPKPVFSITISQETPNVPREQQERELFNEKEDAYLKEDE